MKKSFVLLCCLAVLATSCQRIYYAPNQPSIPHLRDKGDHDLRATYGTGGEVDVIAEVQAAYSPWRYVGVTAQAAYYMGRAARTRGDGWLLEAGAGGYYPVNKWIQMGVYSGYGRGGIYYRSTDGPRETATRFDRYYLQPCIILGPRYAQIFAGLRISRMRYIGTEVLAQGLPDHVLEDIAYIQGRRIFVINEPTFGLRVGSGVLSFHAQLTLIYPIPGQLSFTPAVSWGFSVNPERFGARRRKVDTSTALRW